MARSARLFWAALSGTEGRPAALTLTKGTLARTAARILWSRDGVYKHSVNNNGNGMSVRETIVSEIEQIGAKEQLKLPPLTDDLPLSESGLDSLSMAVLVASLEDRLGVDPFTSSDEVQFPVTLGDFVSIYDHALA